MGWSRRIVVATALAAGLTLLGAVPSRADHWHRGRPGHHGHMHYGVHYGAHYAVRGGPRVVIGVGPAFGYAPGFWWGPPGWYGPVPYYYPVPSYYPTPPPVVIQAPPVYIERSEPAPSEPAPSSWYYCPSAKAYYPTAPTCPEPWVEVPARPGSQ